MRVLAVHCVLGPIKKVNDTIITITPKDCNIIHFDSTENGQWKVYAADTTTLIEIVSIKNGQRNGTNIDFYSNSQIKSKAEYKNGKLNGAYISFFETGKIYMKGYYKTDKRESEIFTGAVTEYWDNGIIAKQFSQKDNSYPVDTKYWDKDGNVVAREKYFKLWYDCK